MVNVSHYRCDALILTPGGIQTVPLPDLSAESVSEHVVAFLTALAAAHDRTKPLPERWRAQQVILETLAWLWDTVTGPVLEALHLTTTPAPGGPWPRLWWSPTGLLNFLPLHAAGHHRERGRPGARTVLDRVVCSYTTTVRALRHLRGRATTRDQAGRLLVVALPHTPGAEDLPGAWQEADLLAERFGATALIGPDATYERVLAELPAHRWVHFACHGASDITAPSRSRLLVHDHQQRPLTVLDVSRLHLEQAELAFLSACGTASASITLADEAVHIASAFQLAGYRHVIAPCGPSTTTSRSVSRTSFTPSWARTPVASPPGRHRRRAARHDPPAPRGLPRHAFPVGLPHPRRDPTSGRIVGR